MLDGTLQSDASSRARHQRAIGELRLSVRQTDGRSRLHRRFQSGAAKAHAPAVYGHDGLEAVLINTAGGLTGGDRMNADLSVCEGAAGIFTTQASEKIYRASEGCADVLTRFAVERGAIGCWVPQDTIFFDGARLRRRLEVDVWQGAQALLIEPIVFGRAAMGERVRQGLFHDSWRVRLDGRLVFADESRLEGDIATTLDRAGTGGGADAFLTGVFVGADLERRLSDLRAIPCGSDVVAGASVVRDSLTFRVAARTSSRMRVWWMEAYGRLTGRPAPAVWRC